MIMVEKLYHQTMMNDPSENRHSKPPMEQRVQFSPRAVLLNLRTVPVYQTPYGYRAEITHNALTTCAGMVQPAMLDALRRALPDDPNLSRDRSDLEQLYWLLESLTR